MTGRIWFIPTEALPSREAPTVAQLNAALEHPGTVELPVAFQEADRG